MSKSLRDAILFFAGLAGIAYETVIEHTDRPTLLVAFAAMLGLPLFLRADESTKKAAEQQPPPPPPAGPVKPE